jgi:hypothetical protein
MLLVCLMAYQYINRQKDHRVFREELRSLMDEDSDDIPLVQEGLPRGQMALSIYT